MNNIFTLRPWHWLTAIALAFILHAAFIIQLNKNSIAVGESKEVQSITVTLKKLTAPIVPEVKPETKMPDLPSPVTSEKPLPKAQPKKKPPKPQPKKKPQVDQPPPVIKPAEVQEIKTETTQAEVNDRPARTTNDTQNQKPVTIDKSAHASVDKKVNNTSQIRNDYLVKLGTWLAKHKRYPSIARRKKQEDTVKVRFVIDAEGALVRYQLLEASKYSSLNKAVEKLLEDASPMPSVPTAIRQGKNEFEYTIPIEYKLLND